MQTGVARKVGFATAIMMASVLLSRVIGLLREMSIAYVGGADNAVDAYQVAFVLPEILNHVVATGFLSITFIPIFTRYLGQGRESRGWEVLSLVLTTFGAVLLALVVLAEIWTPRIVLALAPGLADRPAWVLETAVNMTRIILPAQLFFFAGGLFMAVQYAKEQFWIPALAPLLYNLGIIAGGWLLGPRLGMSGFAWGVLAGALVGNLVLQYWGARRVGMRLRPVLNWRDAALWRYLRLTLPLIVGLSATFSTEVFFRFFGSFLAGGAVAALNYALRLMMMMVGFFGQAVGTAAYPFLARLAAEGRLAELNELLNTTLRHLSAVIPITFLIMVLRHEIVRVLFQRGSFDAASTALTAGLLVYLLVGAFGFAAQTVVVRGFYAMQNTLFPAVFSTLAVAAGLPLYWAGMHWMGARGVALAVSLTALLQVGVLFTAWNRRQANRGAAAVYRAIARLTVAGALPAAAAETVRRQLAAAFDTTSLTGSLALMLIVGSLFLALMALMERWLPMPEITLLRSKLIQRVWKSRGSRAPREGS